MTEAETVTVELKWKGRVLYVGQIYFGYVFYTQAGKVRWKSKYKEDTAPDESSARTALMAAAKEALGG